jgi:hypothetical protein
MGRGESNQEGLGIRPANSFVLFDLRKSDLLRLVEDSDLDATRPALRAFVEGLTNEQMEWIAAHFFDNWGSAMGHEDDIHFMMNGPFDTTNEDDEEYILQYTQRPLTSSEASYPLLTMTREEMMESLGGFFGDDVEFLRHLSDEQLQRYCCIESAVIHSGGDTEEDLSSMIRDLYKDPEQMSV